ncbi:unnamed protein product, partial [Cyprideis torosa]
QRQVQGCPFILTLIGSSCRSLGGVRDEFYVLTELCSGGLIDVLQARTDPLPLPLTTKVFYQACKAVQALHSLSPPLIHRDLKIDNFLISLDGSLLKLCDFGSATRESHCPDSSWSAHQRALLEDEVRR